jgi:hypothetical protein
MKSSLVRHHSINHLKVDPYIEDDYIQFCTIGNEGTFTMWRLDIKQQLFQNYDVPPPEYYRNHNFVSIAFTPFLQSPINTYLILLGVSDGSLLAFD